MLATIAPPMQDCLLYRVVYHHLYVYGYHPNERKCGTPKNARCRLKSELLTDEPCSRIARARLRFRRSRKLGHGARLEFGHSRGASAMAVDQSDRVSAAFLVNVASRQGLCGRLQVVRLAAVQKRASPPSALPGLQSSL